MHVWDTLDTQDIESPLETLDTQDIEQTSILEPLEASILEHNKPRRPSQISLISEPLTCTTSVPCTPYEEARFNFGADKAANGMENEEETVDDFMAVINESSEVELSHGQSKVFLADNKLLQSLDPGLTYYRSPCLSDVDSHRAFVPWGSMVYGTEVCKGQWLKVQERFLPTKINGITVLRPYFQPAA